MMHIFLGSLLPALRRSSRAHMIDVFNLLLLQAGNDDRCRLALREFRALVAETLGASSVPTDDKE